jgi:farnesyl diphosphate synthase
MNLTDLFNVCQTRLEKIFNQYLNEPRTDARLLQDAMSYAVLNGGKRVRPAFVYAAHPLFDAPLENCDAPAAAIEFIHSYSLIHDDLPAMDNADLRRGQPSCHKKFGEALAILAGDTLQPLAFEIITSHPAPLSTAQRLSMIQILARASGYHGMAAGQVLDILGKMTKDSLTQMYQLKTGALLSASLQLGAVSGNITDPTILQSLDKFTHCIGLAFQIQDDLLDFENESITGKTKGLDASLNKMTYPVLFGVEESKKTVNTLFEEAHASIEFLGKKGHILKELADYILKRKN